MNISPIYFFKKIHHFINYPRLFYPAVPEQTFPDNPQNSIRINIRLRAIKNELRRRTLRYNLGALYTAPHPLAITAYRYFLDQNPNHLGNWSTIPPQYTTQQLEYEVVHKMIDLFRAKREHLEGYITSGGTEGNLYAVWLGRSYLEQWCKKESITVLHTSLTHYSVNKAAHVCGIDQHLVPVDMTSWTMHPEGLANTIHTLYTKGTRGFLLPLTIGYTATGTADNLKEITRTIHLLQKKYRHSRYYLWIDAASDGFVEPFLNTKFFPFTSPFIHAMIVDFHKFGLVPYPGGIVVYRKKLRRLIEKNIDYLSVKDNTLTGSRTGISAVAVWTMMHSFGKKGYRNMFQKQMELKKYFLQKLRCIVPSAQVLSSDYSLTAGVIFRPPHAPFLPKYLEQKYWLYAGKTNVLFYPHVKKAEIIYKFHFQPHLSKNILEEFFHDLT